MSENDRVQQAMLVLSQIGERPETPLADPHRIWLEAQLLQRQVKQERALLPVRIAAAVGSGALAVAASRIPFAALPSLAGSLPLPLLGAAAWTLMAIPLFLLLSPYLFD